MPATTSNNLTGSLGGSVVLASDDYYVFHSFPTRRSSDLALGDHVETFSYSIADGHGDVSTSTLTITVTVAPEAVTATADTQAVTDDSTLTVLEIGRAHV